MIILDGKNISKNIKENIRKEVDSPLKTMLREYNRELYGLDEVEGIINSCNKVSSKDIEEVASKMEKKFSVILKEAI